MTETVLRLLGEAQLRVTDPNGTHRTLTPHPGRVTGILGLLALNPGRVVTMDRLVDELWPEGAPDSARATVHVNISRLRRQLRPTELRIETRAPGYALEGPDDAVDIDVYRRLVREAQAAANDGDWAAVLDACSHAGGLWRGEPFAATTLPTLQLERDDLLNRRQALSELHCRALIETGRPEEALVLARGLREADPYAESGAWALMRCLQDTGRPAAALDAYDEYRTTLADDLGLDPGPLVSRLRLDILRGHGDVPAPPPVSAPAADVPAERDDRHGMAGRTAERAVLREVVAGLGSSRPAVVLLEGESGIGKTTLARYATTVAAQRGVRVVWSGAVDGMAMPPLALWRRVLTGLGVADGPPGSQDPFTYYDAMVGHVLRAVGDRPALVVLDDLQWADDGTLQVLQLLANRVWAEPLAVIATRRPTSAPVTAAAATALDRIGREHITRRIELGPLSVDDIAAVSEDADAAVLWRRSGGNPFLLRELLRDNGGGDIASVRSGVPSGVRSIVLARALALPERSRALLDAAAVAGSSFDLALLAEAFGMTAEDTAKALQPAVDQELVSVGTPGRFRHDLFREALIGLQTARQRSLLHERLADALGSLHGDDLDEVAADLAAHRYEAALGRPSMRAFEACSRAADLATRAMAFDHACSHRSRALALLPRSPEHRPVRFACLMSLTQERRRVGDVVGASAALEEARRIATSLGDDERLRDALSLLGGPTLWNWRQFEEFDADTVATLERLLAVEDDAADRARLLGTLGVELYYGPRHEPGVDAAREAVRIAEGLGDVPLLARTLNNFAIASWRPEHRDERREAIDRTLALTGRGLSPTSEAIALLHRAPLLLRRGELLDARADLSRAEWLAPRTGRPELEGQVATQLAGFAMLEGDDEWAEESIERAYEILSRTSLWGARWIRQVQRITLLRDRGSAEEGLDDLLRTASEDAFRMLRWTAVLTLAECGRERDARAMQKRWGMTRLSDTAYWNSDFDDVQAGMVAVHLGVPDPATVYERLRRSAGELAVAGTGLAVWGQVDDVRADLADRLGRDDEARTLRAAARRRRRTVTDQLAGNPEER